MTGYARVRKTIDAGEITMSVKSVNHRGLDLHFHLPPDLDPFESAIRAALKKGVARGHLQIHINLLRAGARNGAALNRELLQAYIDSFRAAAAELELKCEPDLNVAMQIPGMFRESDIEEDSDAALETALIAITEEAVLALNAFREREAAAILGEMRERCSNLRDLADRMQKIRAQAVPAFQKRLKERLGELLRGTALEPQRLAQEAAVLADRSDIAEELIRLKTHADQLETLLNTHGEIGKRLDFLLQEMNRESNTILSKTGGLGDLGLTITDLALASKAEIDKIREQSLNLE